MQNTTPGSVDALLDGARQQALLGHWEDAALAAEATLALDPDSAEAHHIAARARLKQGMIAGALNHAERAVELDGSNMEYQETLAEVMRGGPSSPASSPIFLASIAALAVVVLVLVFAFAGRPKPKQAPAAPTATPTGQASPFAQPPPGAAYPQPSRPSGVNYDGPRVPSRTAPPGPTALAGANPAHQTPATGSAMPAGAATTLPPAPVDASALQRFAPPAPAQASIPAPSAPTPQRNGRQTPSIVPPLSSAHMQHGEVAPPPPAGGTIFGPTPAQRATQPAVETPRQPSPEPRSPATPPTQATPQQQYVERDYGAAAQGFQQQIEAGHATGAKYQQLGLSYERLGDRQKATQAYQNAISAYKAQLQAGKDTEIATRGLRSTQRALNMLQGR